MAKSSKDFEVKFDEVNVHESTESQVTNSQLGNSQVDNQDEVESTETETQESQYIQFDQLKTEINQKSVTEILNIRKYLPIIEKGILVSNIVSASTDVDDNNMTRINYNSLEIFSHIYMIEQFTNFAFEADNMINELDYMLEHNIVEQIYKEIGTEIRWGIKGCVQEEIRQIREIENSIESVINKHMFLIQDKLQTLINKVPDVSEGKIDQWIKLATKAMSKFKPENVKLIQELSDFAKGTGK